MAKAQAVKNIKAKKTMESGSGRGPYMKGRPETTFQVACEAIRIGELSV